MDDGAKRQHWDNIYAAKGEAGVSWFEAEPSLSLALIAEAGVSPTATIVDVGAGASHLMDELMARGGRDLTALDISDEGLAVARKRLGAQASAVRWVVSDVTSWTPDRAYDLWHDRAVFHFLLDAAERAAYVRTLSAALKPGGTAIVGTFALDGPEKCSGLPVMRYDARQMADALGSEFTLIGERRAEHVTPWASVQKFQFGVFRRK